MPHASLVLGFLFIVLTTVSLSGQTNDGFELVRERGEIRIYERWGTFPGSDPPVEAREVKGVFFANCTIKEAVALVQNEAQIGRWQSHVSKFRVYPLSDSVWHEYSYHDIPWPVSDQDHYLEYRVRIHVPGEKLFVTFESIEDNERAAISEDATRMTLAGSWLFEAVGSRTRITYSILSMPMSIPRVFTDPVIRSNMMSTITSYIKALEESREKEAR